MRIIDFKIRHKLSFDFKPVINNDSDVIIFHSKINSTGKTTLLRAVLYTLGFNIPDTELVKFRDYEFIMTCAVKNATYKIVRRDALIMVNDTEFDLPVDELAVRSHIFSITNQDLLNNILGAIYFDQEKGWTLLNRGTIIGINRFSIESFFRGLNDDESQESSRLESELNAIEKKIAQYNLMSNVAEYQEAINTNVSKKLYYDTYDEELERELLEKQQRLSIVERELSSVSDIIKRNKNFVDYLEKKKIFIQAPDNTILQVTRHNLYNYDPVFESNEARRSLLVAERNILKKRISEIESMREKQLSFENVNNLEVALVQRLAEIKSISSLEIQSILKKLKKEREKIKEQLLSRTKHNNIWIEEIQKTISNYAIELEIPSKYRIDIFTNKLKSKSGAILHKLVFIYKLAYIKAISKKLGYPVPIFCDSPSGREVEDETIKTMLKIIKRDFSENQLIIASIFEYNEIFDNADIVTLNGTLFNQQTLLD